MEPENTAAPAGDSSTTSPSEASYSEPKPITMSAAADLLAFDDAQPEPEAATAEEPAPTETEEAAAPEAEEGEEADEASQPAEKAEPEPADDESESYVHGNARTRLRDGTVTTVAELKKLADEAREYRAKVPQLSAQEQQLRAREAQITQQQKLFQQALPIALQKLQRDIPPAPDPSLLETDPFAHYEQTQKRELKLAELRQLQAAQAAHEQQLKAAQTVEQEKAVAQKQQYLAAQQERLLEKLPDLRTPEKRDVIYKGFVDTASKYGFNKSEVDNVFDHRLFHMVHDLSRKAAAYDKLQAQKPVVAKKAENAVPVKAPDKRVSTAERQSRSLDEQFAKLRSRGGRLEDAASILANL